MSQKDPKGFWNKRAKTFPRYSPDENSYEAGMLHMARDHGVIFKDKNILDVGCGCGMYTIRLALEGRRVTALDISEEMLAILKSDAEKMRLTNLEYVNSGWLDFQENQSYDLLFCSMTPALGDEAGKEKALSYGGATVVYVGWNGGMHSSVMAGLYDHYQVTPNAFNFSPEMRRWLSDHGLKYQALPKEGQWRVPFVKQELADQCFNMLANYGVEPDPAYIGDHLKKFKQADGSYLEVTDYKVEMLIWQND